MQWLARLRFDAGRPEDAITLLRRAIELDPEDPDMWGALAGVLASVGRLEEAQAARAELERLTTPQ